MVNVANLSFMDIQASPDTSSYTPKSPRRGRSRKRKTQTNEGGAKGKKSTTRQENLAAVYFQDVATLAVLKPNEEFEMARRIERQEVALWSQLLSHPGMLVPILDLVPHRDQLHGLDSLRRAARSLRARRTAAARKLYETHHQRLAAQLRTLDLDRNLVELILDLVGQFAQGKGNMQRRSPIRVNTQSKSFKGYYKKVQQLGRSSQAARNQLVKANLRLVVAIVNRYKFGRLAFTDLIQEGNLGLIKAVGRYDYRRGCRFSTYAGWWIRHSITRAIADKGRMVRVPVHVLDSHHKMDQAAWQLSSKLGRVPTAEEISCSTNLNREKVLKLRANPPNHAFSLDNFLSDDDSRSFIEMMQDPDSPLPSQRVQDQEVLEHVRQIFWDLKPIESDVLRRRFGLVDGRTCSLKDIGRDYSLSRERIRQIQEQALGKIRKALSRRKAI